MGVDINVWAVMLAAISSMVVGGAWYAKAGLGKTWMRLAKMDEKKINDKAPKALALAFVLHSCHTAFSVTHFCKTR
jgi:hypothetical protein